MEINMCITFFTAIWTSLVYISSGSRVNTTCDFTIDGVWTCNYIPLNIPEGVIQVHIENFMQHTDMFDINHTYFKSDNWQSVKYLKFTDRLGLESYGDITFKDDALSDLRELEELHLQVDSVVTLEPYSLSGLKKVRILDFSKCIRMNLNQVKAALNGSEKVPNLEQLILSELNSYREYLQIDREFSKCLSHKPLFHIDLSKTHITILEVQMMKDLDRLKKLNVSGAVIGEVIHDTATPHDFQHLEIVDFSYCNFGDMAFPSNKHNLSISNVNLPWKDRGRHVSMTLSPEILNGSGIINVDIYLNTIKFFSVDNFKSWTKEIILMKNSLRRLDIEIACDNFDLNSIERLNIADNGLEYIHPSIFTCIPNLADLDLSENNLHLMYMENIHLFGKLLKGAKNVKNLSLAFNRFIGIPEEFFDSIDMLEIINLAGNRLTQVHFKLHHLRNLRVLNLAKNNIKVLDEASMKWLDTLAAVVEAVEDNTNIGTGTSTIGRVEVDIKGNPLMCDTCEKKMFISWLSNAELIDTLSGNVTCRSETGDQLQVNKEAVTLVQHVCDRNTRNLILIIMTSVISAISASVALIVYMRRKHVRKQRKRIDVMNELRLGEVRFAVFLSYSSDDGDFVRENVVEPLNEGLQRIIDTDRILVCQGDSEFRLGRYVHNESLRCIELSTVFISVISNSYCSSNYCEGEFNQALQLGKPVLLMIKDNVDEELMAPAMQLLFRNKVRVLWAYENEQYRLKTSWQNVCESILDMASN